MPLRLDEHISAAQSLYTGLCSDGPPPGRTLELEDLFMDVPGAKGALRVEERRRRRRPGSWLSRGTTDSPVGGFAAIGIQAWSWGVPGMEVK